jgi:PHP family Zn ribbon phosphoesterase
MALWQLERRDDMGKQVKLIALVDEEQRKRLYHILLDEGVSFAEWLRRQIDAYTEEKKPKAKRKGKEA